MAERKYGTIVRGNTTFYIASMTPDEASLHPPVPEGEGFPYWLTNSKGITFPDLVKEEITSLTEEEFNDAANRGFA